MQGGIYLCSEPSAGCIPSACHTGDVVTPHDLTTYLAETTTWQQIESGCDCAMWFAGQGKVIRV